MDACCSRWGLLTAGDGCWGGVVADLCHASVMAEPGSCFCAAFGFDRGHSEGARSPGVGRKPHALTFEYQHQHPIFFCQLRLVEC
jgi:hypothetical protein